MVPPSWPKERAGSGASILLEEIKRLLWEALGLLGKHQELERYVMCFSVPRESPPSVRLGKSLSAPSLSCLLRKDALSEY